MLFFLTHHYIRCCNLYGAAQGADHVYSSAEVVSSLSSRIMPGSCVHMVLGRCQVRSLVHSQCAGFESASPAMQLSAPDMERAVAAEERRAYLLPLCRYHMSAWLMV